jgi:hypothetical protein
VSGPVICEARKVLVIIQVRLTHRQHSLAMILRRTIDTGGMVQHWHNDTCADRRQLITAVKNRQNS